MRMPPVDIGRDVIGGIRARATIDVPVTVRLRRVTRWRLWLAGHVIKFGGWLAGFQHTDVDIKHG